MKCAIRGENELFQARVRPSARVGLEDTKDARGRVLKTSHPSLN